MNRQDSVADLEEQTASLRRTLTLDPKQLSEIHKLYFRYVELGRPFPADLEEHSLWLILKFIRPDDAEVAGRLVTVLEMQGKPVPANVKLLAVREFALPYEKIAEYKRNRALSDARTSAQSTAPLHERLFFVIGLPKSASRLMVRAIAAMHPIERVKKQAQLPYTTGYPGIDATTDLRPDSLVGFTDGGIVHSHLNPTNVNRHALAHLGLGYVITVRHPADHIAAFYCHLRRISERPFLIDEIRERMEEVQQSGALSPIDTYTGAGEPNRLFFHGNIFPIDLRFLAPAAKVDDAIAHLIANGYLHYALTWIVSWQLLRIRNTSIIVRYEDFIGDPEAALRRVNQAIFPANPEDAVISGCKVFAKESYDTSSESNIYPRGPTGTQDIWRNYFSPENRRLYNSVCEQFLAAHPYGPMLKELYPDLLTN